MTRPSIGDLAFVGPAHTNVLTDFQYIELVQLEDTTATVKIVSTVEPESDEDEEKPLKLPVTTFQNRAVLACERGLWPGSYVAHPVAYVCTSAEGVDEWTYGVVTGYTASVDMTILHIVCHGGHTRVQLTDSTAIIKADVLNYALQTGRGLNALVLSATELLLQQNTVIEACQRRRTGLPSKVTNLLSMPYSGEEIIPLVRPSDLQLVRVRRQHILDYKMAARTKRPEDLYTDSEVGVLMQANPVPSTTSPKAYRAMQKRALKPTVETAGDDDSDIGGDSDSLDSDGEAVQELQHMHRPLAKRRRVELTSHSEVASSDDNVTTRERGIVFHPSPTDRRVHNAVVRGRHKGKVGQTLLQSAQLCDLDFIGTPPVLQGAYHFGFGVGLSIMHFRRALHTDDVANTEKGVNMWDFSSRNSLPPPPKAVTFSDLIGALSAFYKFAKYFYNTDVKRFIGKARDFVIAYADNASHDSAMPRVLTIWVNSKFGKFRSRLVTKGINSALRVAKEFSRNDEQLLALKEAAPTWGQKKQNTFHQRINTTDGRPRVSRQPPNRQHQSERIPASVIASLPKGDDGRRLCLRSLSNAGCTVSDCARAHFRPKELSDEAKGVIDQRWRGLSSEFKDL